MNIRELINALEAIAQDRGDSIEVWIYDGEYGTGHIPTPEVQSYFFNYVNEARTCAPHLDDRPPLAGGYASYGDGIKRDVVIL